MPHPFGSRCVISPSGHWASRSPRFDPEQPHRDDRGQRCHRARRPDGGISVYASDSTELVVDIDGYFAAPRSGGLSLYPTAPCRVIDTRNNNGQPWQGERTINVAGSPCAPSSDAQAYVFNATVVPPGPMHYLTLWADQGTQPQASTLNAVDGAITSNLAIVPNTNGSTDAYASDATQLILDISSYFAP